MAAAAFLAQALAPNEIINNKSSAAGPAHWLGQPGCLDFRSLDFRQHGTAVPAPQDQLFGKTRSGPGRRRRRHYSSGGGGAAAAAAGHGARWPKRPRQWRGTRTAAPRHRGQRMDNTLRLAIGSGSMSEGAAPTTSWCWLLVLVAAPDPPTDSMISCARTGFWLRRLYC